MTITIIQRIRIIIISTHTLTWSVTSAIDEYLRGNVISTHTLTWSVTIAVISTLHYVQYFNSHAHVERD